MAVTCRDRLNKCLFLASARPRLVSFSRRKEKVRRFPEDLKTRGWWRRRLPLLLFPKTHPFAVNWLYMSLFSPVAHHASSPMHFAKSHVAMKFAHAQRKQIANDRYCGSPAKQIIPSILLYNARNQSRGLPPDRSDAPVTRRFIGHKHRLPPCCAFFSRTLELIDGATEPVGGGRGANKFGNFFTCHPRVRWRSRKQTDDLAEGRIRSPTTIERVQRSTETGEQRREREPATEDRENLDDAGKGDDGGGGTQNGGRRLIRAPFTGNLCTRSIKPAPRLSGRSSRGIQTTGKSTIVPFIPSISFFHLAPFLPSLLCLSLSPSVFFFPFCFPSLFFFSLRYNPSRYCTSSRIMMLDMEWERRKDVKGKIGARTGALVEK